MNSRRPSRRRGVYPRAGRRPDPWAPPQDDDGFFDGLAKERHPDERPERASRRTHSADPAITKRLPDPAPARKLAAMSDFVPPYPGRPREPLGPVALMATARRNFLAVFEEK